MKRVIDTSEILGTVQTPQGPCEVCAAADARYDEAAGRLVVALNAFLRPSDLRRPDQPIPAPWLPGQETVSEAVGPEETVALARDIFQRWVRKVRRALPAGLARESSPQHV